MNLPECDYQILRLTSNFYSTYPNPPFTEILKKGACAYTCLIFQTHYNFFICIPYRSEISHPYSFRFKQSKRSLNHNSGLDYTKIVIITRTDFMDNIDALIDKDEFNQTMININKIERQALEYVEDYMNHMKGVKLVPAQEFARKYSFSPLKYFHAEMGIS